jgi:hypothetical protein
MQRVLGMLVWAMVALAAVVFTPAPAAASCACACVDGQAKPICSNPLEIAGSCPSTVCPLATPANPILPPPTSPQTLPSNPAERCTDRQVYNPQTGQNEWRRLCS